MKPKTPLPWEPADTSLGLIRMYPEDYNFAVHAANWHPKLVKWIEVLSLGGVHPECVEQAADKILKEIGENDEH